MQIRKKLRLQKIWTASEDSVHKKLNEFNVHKLLKTNPITTTGILTYKVQAPNTHVISSNKSPNWQKTNSSKKY